MDENTLTIAYTEHLEHHLDDLATRYHQVLSETLFTNRGQVRPTILKDLAMDQACALLDFFRAPSSPGTDRGVQLYQLGLGEQSLLRLAQTTRQFFLKSLDDGQVAPALDLVDRYYNAMVQAYIRSLEKSIQEEQERTRRAFLQVMGRSADDPPNP